MRLQGKSGKQERKRKPPVISRPVGKIDATLPKMLDGQKEAERKPETLKTMEIIDGVPHFYLVIPCSIEPAKGPTPLYLVKENELGGPESGVWQCQECTEIFYNRRSWEKHKGIRWVTGPETKICS